MDVIGAQAQARACSPADGRFVTAPVRIGSRGDSYYEYLLKQYLQTVTNLLRVGAETETDAVCRT
jgi:hypothetical protein